MAEPRPDRPLWARSLDALAPYLLTLAIGAPVAAYAAVRLRGADVHFRHPRALLLLLVVPFGAWVGFHLERRRAGTFVHTRAAELRRTAQGLFGRLMHLPGVLRLVALGLLALSLARPQRLSTDASEVEGIDIVVALDVSNSMQETDLVPDRITAAKRVIDDFIRRREADRIGLVLFGREAFTQCPLTLDTRALRGLLAEVRLGLIDGQGTAIGNALGTAVNRLRDPDCQKREGAERLRCEEQQGSRAKSKVVVLVTDGDDNASKIDPRTAARLAQAFGVKVFTILIGQDAAAGSPGPPGHDRFGNLILGSRQRYPVNPKLLEEIAGITGGVPYLATDTQALEQRFQAILEDLDRSRIKAQRAHYAELYPLLVAPAVALVLLEILLSLTRFRRFP